MANLALNQTIKDLYESLKPVQQTMFKQVLGFNGRKYVVHSSRRLGKSYLLCALAIVTCLSKKNSQVRYASTTKLSVRKIIKPIIKDISKNLPLKFRPVWNQQDGVYKFYNGSELHIAGVNKGNADSLRGTSSDLAIIDEAGFIDELTYLVDSVLMPQLLSVNGKLIMSSSSPLSPAHEFTAFIHEAKANGFYSSYTIHDGGYTAKIVEEFCKETGGEESTAWRREYLNELIVDKSYSVTPEFDEEQHVKDTPRTDLYPLLHKYTAADWGVQDNTSILFGYYDFQKATLVIERELVVNGSDSLTRKIATGIRDIEGQLHWNSVYRRIADSNEKRTLMDLGSEYNIHFQPVEKSDGKQAMINQLRIWLQDNRIIINPSCTNLIGCLKYGVYSNDKRNDFGRSKQFGHYDSLDSLIYLVRNIDEHSNPIPRTHNTTIHTHWTPPQDEQLSPNAEAFKRIFNQKPGR